MIREYRKVITFNFKNQKYNMYLDEDNKHFFLKTNEKGDLFYITDSELLALTEQFINLPHSMNAKFDSSKEKIKLIPKIITNGMAVTLSLSLLTSCVKAYNEEKPEDNIQITPSTQILSEEESKTFISTSNENQLTKELTVDTYTQGNFADFLYIYDMDYLDKAFDYNSVTLEQLYDTIDKNNNISPKYKELLYEYCDNLIQNYPDVELRVLYENLKTLEIIECDAENLLKHTGDSSSYATYNRKENKIYTAKDYQYEKGTWQYQVIFHEFSHCLRTGSYNKNGTEVKVQVEGQNFNNTITTEALNSLFAVSLLDYEEPSIAYGLQSHYYGIMIECMDNYNLSDYINHSQSYFAKKLDEFNGDQNYSTVILELIQAQYNDYHNPEISVEQSEYYPIYDYISSMYYNTYITPDMSYDQAKEVANTLVSQVTYEVPETYNIDTNRFYDDLNYYCDSIGISINAKTR